MANHALPTTASLYTDVLTNLKDRIDDSLKMLDSVNTTPTNVPTNAVRFNSTTTIWEKYNGSSWISLAASYAIKVLKSTNLVGGNSTTLLGSIPYQSNTDTTTLLAPNKTTTRKFLRQTGTGTNGAAPVWDTILASDVPTLNQNTTGSAATLTTARTINGVSFNGSANINIEDRLGTPIESASTTTIGTAGLGDYIHITGTTTITSFGTASTAGIRRTLIFDGALTLTHNATSLICVGGASIVTVAGMVIEVVAETTANWRVVSITHPSISATELGYLNGVTSGIQTQISAKVGKTGDETIAGVKTFTSSPIVPTPTSGTQAVNKDYVDSATDRIGLIDYSYVAKPYHIVAFGGEFNRADYPKLWAYLQANPTLVKTQAQWTTESTANGGICGFFSDGDGTTTFRVPNLDKAFLRPDNRGVGRYQEGSYLAGDSIGDSLNPLSLFNYDTNLSLFRSRMNWDNLSTVSIGEENLKYTAAVGNEQGSYITIPSIFGVARPKNIAVLPLIVAK